MGNLRFSFYLGVLCAAALDLSAGIPESWAAGVPSFNLKLGFIESALACSLYHNSARGSSGSAL